MISLSHDVDVVQNSENTIRNKTIRELVSGLSDEATGFIARTKFSKGKMKTGNQGSLSD